MRIREIAASDLEAVYRLLAANGWAHRIPDEAYLTTGLDCSPVNHAAKGRPLMKPWLISIACIAATGATHAAESCETLRAQIESKIAAAGVTRFAVLTVDANAPATGQVVGSCELGTRKIVYQRDVGSAPGAAVPATTPPSPPEDSNILTECKDGTVSVGGTCKR
jgi:hypothetical protein